MWEYEVCFVREDVLADWYNNERIRGSELGMLSKAGSAIPPRGARKAYLWYNVAFDQILEDRDSFVITGANRSFSHVILFEKSTSMDHLATSVDKVVLKGVKFEAVVGLDVWHRPNKPQPVELEVHLTPPGGLEAAAQEDAVAYTIDYGKLYKSLRAVIFDQKFDGVTQLYQAIKASLPETTSWHINIALPKAILAANNGLSMTWTGHVDESGPSPVMQVMVIRDIECRCIIGVNSHERLEKQRLGITILVWGLENRLSPSILAGVSIDPCPNLVYQGLVKEVVDRVEGSSYETIEALAVAIAQIVTLGHGFDNARVNIDKPGGLAGLGASGVSISRSKAYFENKDFWKVKRP